MKAALPTPDAAGAAPPGELRRRARVALFAALAAALGFLLAPLPNLELFTFSLFMAGQALGARDGLAAGCLAVLLYYGLNPYGSSLAFPPLFAGQLAAGAGIVALGALHARLARGARAPRWARRLLLLPFALLAALFLPLLPALALALLSGAAWQGWLGLGALMTSWGLGFNLLVFLGAREPLARQLARQGYAGVAA